MSQEPEPMQTERTRKNPVKTRSAKTAVVAVVAVVAIGVVALLLWLFIPRGSGGRPVPAPRNIGPDQTANQPGSGESTLTLTPEQVQRSGIKIETVGERVSTATTGQPTTGIVQPNSYRETPLMSLVGGIVRSVGLELGQTVRKGQTVVVVSSNDLADAQTKYLAAFAELEEHHKHHTRAEKLVEIGAASREELEMAASKLKAAESDVANLRQRLLLLGLSPQRVSALHSTTQVSSEVSLAAPASGTVTSRTVKSW